MTVLSGLTIRARKIFTPHCERTLWRGLTYGEGPASYDVRVEFEDMVLYKELQPGDFILAATIEHFTMPDDVMGVAHDKSTWVRQGLTVQNTVIDPGWRGHLTLEIANHSQSPITLHRGHPIAQIVFHGLDQPVEGYQGKYQDQVRGPVRAIHERE